MLPLRGRVDLRALAMKTYSSFSKAVLYLNLTIRIFRVISRILVVEGSNLLVEKQFVSTAPTRWAIAY